jgi:hypothetical protein
MILIPFYNFCKVFTFYFPNFNWSHYSSGIHWYSICTFIWYLL